MIIKIIPILSASRLITLIKFSLILSNFPLKNSKIANSCKIANSSNRNHVKLKLTQFINIISDIIEQQNRNHVKLKLTQFNRIISHIIDQQNKNQRLRREDQLTCNGELATNCKSATQIADDLGRTIWGRLMIWGFCAREKKRRLWVSETVRG